MVVQHNMQALNANRMLGITSNLQAKSTEKLASGYQINRAADDAAGLSISEKMRKQIKGLDQASTNAQDGISSVQTAEGALTEVHSMLQRMNELAVQAANGTNSETDRQSIQDEIDQLTTEIDRVAETTKFNETYLLKGNGKTTKVKINAKDAGIEGQLTGVGTGKATFKMDALKTAEQITIGAKGYTIGSTKEDIEAALTAHLSDNGGEAKITIEGTEYTVNSTVTTDDFENNKISDETAKALISDGKKAIIGDKTYVMLTDGNPMSGDDLIAAKPANGTVVTIGGTGYTIDENDTDGFRTAKEVAIAKIKDHLKTANATIGIGGTAYTAGHTGLENALAGLTDTSTFSLGSARTTIGTTSGWTADNTATIDEIAAKVDAAAKDTIVKYMSGSTQKTLTVGENLTADGIGENDASVITKEAAYKLIKEELAKAGSTGADPGKEASVKMADFNKDATEWSYTITEGEVSTKQGLQFALHVGADADENNKIALTISAMDSTSLGISGINVVDNTGAKATYAIDAIADAIAKVSEQRSALGAVQNRLEHTIANLDNVVENTTSAESAIRDTDMAAEMVNYSKNNILAQAGQAMLAQANSSNQGVLSLLG